MKGIILFLMLSPFLAGCAGVDIKQDYDTSVDFQKFKTYAWQPRASNGTTTEAADNSLVNERVRNSVDALLSTKGFQGKSPGESDFLVTYQYTVT